MTPTKQLRPRPGPWYWLWSSTLSSWCGSAWGQCNKCDECSECKDCWSMFGDNVKLWNILKYYKPPWQAEIKEVAPGLQNVSESVWLQLQRLHGLCLRADSSCVGISRNQSESVATMKILKCDYNDWNMCKCREHLHYIQVIHVIQNL